MTERRRGPFPLLALMLTVIPAAAPAGDWVTLNPLQLEALLIFDGWRRDYNNAKTRQEEWRGGLRLEQDGYVLDPRILSFSYYLEPQYVAGSFEYPGYSEDSSDNFLNYYLTLDWLQGSLLPVSGSFVASNTSQTLTSSLGRRADSETGHYLALVSWDNAWLPATFQYDKRTLYSLSTSAAGSRPRLRDQEEDSVTVRARNRRLGVNVQQRRIDDKVPDRNQDFDLDTATVTHRLPWGRGSDLSTRIHYFDRRGFNPSEQLDASEHAHLQHLDNLFSQLEYRYNSIEQTQKTATNFGQYLLNHRLYQNLTTTGRISGRESQSDYFLETERLGGLDLTYSKSDIKGVDVSASLGADYSYNDRDSQLGVQEVVDEPHTVPLSGAVVLNSRFILNASIVVTDETGTQVYIEGLDYTVDSLVDNLTRLLVLPGGEIQVGDRILVSYQAVRLPSVEYNRLNTRESFSFRLGRFSLMYSGSQTNFDVISGLGGSALVDNREANLYVDYFWVTPRTSTRISAERTDYRNGLFESRSYTYGQSFDFNPSPTSRVGVNLTQSFSKGTEDEVDVYVVDLLVTWQPRPSWSIRPTLGAWKRNVNRKDLDNAVSEEEMVSAGISLVWSYRLLSAELTYSHNDHTTDGTDTVTDYLYINLRRRFR